MKQTIRDGLTVLFVLLLLLSVRVSRHRDEVPVPEARPLGLQAADFETETASAPPGPVGSFETVALPAIRIEREQFRRAKPASCVVVTRVLGGA
jgi:hypothetical protein